MSDIKAHKCPNCGAPIRCGSDCSYCGTKLEWEPRIPKTIIEAEQLEVVTLYAEAMVMVDEYELMRSTSKNVKDIEAQIKAKMTEMIVNEAVKEDCVEIQTLYYSDPLDRYIRYRGRMRVLRKER